ncbi:glycoside hydrolase family 88 protein [Alistipes sp.]|uniref:glycoside hydrolase family 88 protein n=1 Tax=Alistipes sp. TaxID=1872444 RepID=UPI0025C17BC4|nr:glycoside hydrolase family 88 protein [Alistipes sp.]
MRRNFRPILGLLSLLVLGSCAADRSPEIASLKHAVGVADSQLLDAAAELDTTNCFPRSLMPKFRAVDAKDWTSGFFPGSLWQCYRLTGNEKLLAEAKKYTDRLEGIQYYKGTHDLGFMVFCSYGQQMQTLHDRHSEEVIVEAAKSLISRCDPRIGVIRSWDFGAWNYPVIIDNMMNLEMLFWASKHTGDPVYRDVAVRHADITLKNHFRDDASSFHVVSYNDDGTIESRGTFQGYSDSSAWARGQAWGLYGYTMCYRETGDAKYLKHAERIADFIMHHPNTPVDRIPYWDYNAPNIPDAPRDASAAAVVSSALFELSTLVPEGDGKKYFDYAEMLLMTLSSESYLAEPGTNGGFILMHSVGHLPAESEIDTPLNYADYYYLEAIGRYLALRGLDARRI